MWHPMCFNKKVALLGTFCVGPTTDEDDKDPNHALPRLTFEVLFTVTFTYMHARYKATRVQRAGLKCDAINVSHLTHSH